MVRGIDEDTVSLREGGAHLAVKCQEVAHEGFHGATHDCVPRMDSSPRPTINTSLFAILSVSLVLRCT